ncbi:unnamed protein product [Amoebophrya sp. A120]|nr:unnamed protein product [Amoebophrya sp. A120]|eukprot:GSA120T00020642001.1
MLSATTSSFSQQQQDHMLEKHDPRATSSREGIHGTSMSRRRLGLGTAACLVLLLLQIVLTRILLAAVQVTDGGGAVVCVKTQHHSGTGARPQGVEPAGTSSPLAPVPGDREKNQSTNKGESLQKMPKNGVVLSCGNGAPTLEAGPGGRFSSEELDKFDLEDPRVSRLQLVDAVKRFRKRVKQLDEMNAQLTAQVLQATETQQITGGAASSSKSAGGTTSTSTSAGSNSSKTLLLGGKKGGGGLAKQKGAAPCGGNKTDQFLRPSAIPDKSVAPCATAWERVAPSRDAGFENGTRYAGPCDVAAVDGNITKKYDVWRCPETATRGHFFVRNLRCQEGNVTFSNDAAYVQRVKKLVGSDEFEFYLLGPELHALTDPSGFRVLGDCQYQLLYNVTTPGRYRAELWMQRERWRGISEAEPRKWIAGNNDDVLGSQVFIDLGTSGAAAEGGASTTSTTGAADVLAAGTAQQQLPRCDLKKNPGDFGFGRWVFRGNGTAGDAKLAAYRPEMVARENLGTFKDHYVWEPRNCHLPYLPGDRAAQCLQGKGILVVGDSHARTLYNALVSHVCGPKGPLGGWHSNSCLEGNGLPDRCKNIKLCVQHDVFNTQLAQTPEKSNLQNFDLVIAGMGQHSSAGNSRWKTAKYVETVSARGAGFAAAVKKFGKPIYWHDLNDFPFRNDGFVRGFQDRRGHSFMRLWNTYAAEEMDKRHIPVLPAFPSSQAWQRQTDAHMPLPVLQASVAQFIWNVLGCST